jgi:hypothetical protein
MIRAIRIHTHRNISDHVHSGAAIDLLRRLIHDLQNRHAKDGRTILHRKAHKRDW